MNIQEAKEYIKQYQAQLKSEQPDNKAFAEVSDISDAFMEMLARDFPDEPDALELLYQFQMVATNRRNTNMFLMVTGLILILQAEQANSNPTLH